MTTNKDTNSNEAPPASKNKSRNPSAPPDGSHDGKPVEANTATSPDSKSRTDDGRNAPKGGNKEEK